MKFRKKPVVIDAFKFDGSLNNHPSLCRDWKDKADHRCFQCGKSWGLHADVLSLEGAVVACPGDWIITGVKGEHYPCKPDIFAATYEPVSASDIIDARGLEKSLQTDTLTAISALSASNASRPSPNPRPQPRKPMPDELTQPSPPERETASETPRTNEVLRIADNWGAIRNAAGDVEDGVTPEEAHEHMVSALITLAHTLERAAPPAEREREELRGELERRAVEQTPLEDQPVLYALTTELAEANEWWDKLVYVMRGWCNFCHGNERACLNAPPGGCTIADYNRVRHPSAAGRDET